MLHSLERILTSSGTYWHTNVCRITDMLDHSVTIHCNIYWVIFTKLFNYIFYYMIICLFALHFYLILYMLICFRTLKMYRLELNIPLIKTYLQNQECLRSMCQPICVNAHKACNNYKPTIMRENNRIASTTSAIPRKHISVCSDRPEYPLSECHCRMVSSAGSFAKVSAINLRTGDRISWTKAFVLFLSPSRQTQTQYLKLEHNSVIPHSFPFHPH